MLIIKLLIQIIPKCAFHMCNYKTTPKIQLLGHTYTIWEVSAK